jgi:hypothetical protein
MPGFKPLISGSALKYSTTVQRPFPELIYLNVEIKSQGENGGDINIGKLLSLLILKVLRASSHAAEVVG